MEHTLGGMIEAGSNSREFWVWERAKENRYYWGEHQWLTNDAEIDLPVRPDVLLDVLGVGDLPTDNTARRARYSGCVRTVTSLFSWITTNRDRGISAK